MIELADSLLTILRKHNLVYVASPYTNYEDGEEMASRDICIATARLIIDGVNAFSPIAHGHAIAAEIYPRVIGHSRWMKFDEATMRVCDALLVVKMPGWRTSRGVGEEIRIFDLAKKPIYYADWS